jgi:hypothetical protein
MLVAIIKNDTVKLRMNKYTIIILLFATVCTYGQELDLLSNGEYSNDPVVDSGLILRLTDLNELLINDLEICDDCEIFRFTWLRTFDNPIIVRIEKKADRYKLIYKIGNGSAGYEPKGLKRTKTIAISNSDWDYFLELLIQTGFNTIPNRYYFPMTDGASWILEHRTGIDYKGHVTNFPNKDFEICCLYLLELASIDYQKDKGYASQIIYLNKDNEIVKEKELLDSLVSYLNRQFANKPPKSKWCNYPDNILTINKRGKVTRVQSLKGEGFFLDLLYYFEDWECRNLYRKSLKGIDLSTFNLKKKFKIYLSANYDKELKIIYLEE